MSNLLFFKVPAGASFIHTNMANESADGNFAIDAWWSCSNIIALREDHVSINSGVGRLIIEFNENFRPEHVWNPERRIGENCQ